MQARPLAVAELQRGIHERGAEVHRTHARAQVRALLGRPDASALLPAITCPTLLLCGRQDHWNPLDSHVDMRERIPAARLEVIEDAGHTITMEAPQAVAEAIAAWLTEDCTTIRRDPGRA
ncbi:alpha/beta fold hydrolase [Cupriavidus necator]|uniref:alpha/beta fold hydrolase n=1 Tax=Cupriavidus necator TaxID=106590 RepID=UPI0009B65C80|nr:alpha/beta hydrolase [Cupriavidus necator]MDX6013613.1 alpha/beta hydrolase [Cupriavidus necator]